MDGTDFFDRGAVVTYLDPDVFAPAAFALGRVTGPQVLDPLTGRRWVSVLRPDRTTLVLDTANVVEIVPARDVPAGPGPA
ncbi:hypothetical protein AB0G02_21025 [Actinosynnema sp. NPDC023658]|uniref:hypothetical protein n=1 Tax=Actinosynnema sp. NPDC023658 TaxID=3155465 RepID=UPI0033C4E4C7